MKRITTESVLLLKSKTSGNHYFRLDGKIVLVNESVAANWDRMDAVNIDEVKYEKRRNDAGELIDEPWSRLEVVGKEDFTITMGKKTRRLEAATSYAKAKNESLNIADLAPSVKEELEALLK